MAYIYYLISKNPYSLQNAQPFIFQLICMQLYKCLNCFLKAHNKQLNQHCLNFIFLFYQKKSFKKWFGVRSGWPAKNMGRVMSQPVLLRVKKIEFGSGIFQVESDWVRKFWPVLPCLHEALLLLHSIKSWETLSQNRVTGVF